MLENREWGEDGRNLSFRETGEKKNSKKGGLIHKEWEQNIYIITYIVRYTLCMLDYLKPEKYTTALD